LAFEVTLRPSGHKYAVEPAQSLLQAGLSAGFFLPYSCRSGVCRTCLGIVREGKVDYGAVHPTYLPDSDKAKGCVLLCQATPLSDLVIELRELEGLAGIVAGKVPCRVVSLKRPAPDVTIVDLRLPMNENMMFVAGQYIDLLLEDGKPSGNMFAAGEIMAGNVLGKGYLAGIGITIGAVFGRLAGEGAARHAQN